MSNHTLKHWLDIYKDLDAYIARGGKLLDLRSFSEQELERLGPTVGDYVGEEMCNRLGRFFTVVGKQGGDRLLGEMLTEKEMQDTWHQTGTIQ